MNLNTSLESHTILMEQPSIPLKLMQENLPHDVLPLEHISMTSLPIIPTGENESKTVSSPSALLFPHKKEENSENPLSSLKSNVKPHVLLEKPIEPKVLRIRKEDIVSLCQVITEFQEQVIGLL